jgi:hypothetical protein
MADMDADAMMERVAEEHFAAEGRGDDKRPLTAALVALYEASVTEELAWEAVLGCALEDSGTYAGYAFDRESARDAVTTALNGRKDG